MTIRLGVSDLRAFIARPFLALGLLWTAPVLSGSSSGTVQGPAPVLPARQLLGGIVVLQHRVDAFDRAPQWSLAPAAIATAGGASSPDYDLTNAWYVELLSDGRLVTLAPVGNRLLVFGPDRGRLRPRSFARMVRRIRKRASCLLWVAGEGP